MNMKVRNQKVIDLRKYASRFNNGAMLKSEIIQLKNEMFREMIKSLLEKTDLKYDVEINNMSPNTATLKMEWNIEEKSLIDRLNEIKLTNDVDLKNHPVPSEINFSHYYGDFLTFGK